VDARLVGLPETLLLQIEAWRRATVAPLLYEYFYEVAVEGSSSSAWMSPNFFSLYCRASRLISSRRAACGLIAIGPGHGDIHQLNSISSRKVPHRPDGDLSHVRG